MNAITFPTADPLVSSSTGGGAAVVPPLVAYWQAARRRKWLIAGVVAAAVGAALLLTLLATPFYSATARIQIDREAQRVTNVEEVSAIDAGENEEFYRTQYALLRARSLAERVVRRLNLATDESFFAAYGVQPTLTGGLGSTRRAEQLRRSSDILLDNLAVLPVRGSSLTDVAFRSPDPEMSAKISNAWVDEFIRSSLDRRFESTQSARAYLEDKLSELRDRLQKSERDLVNYASSRGIVALSQGDAADGKTQAERTLTSLNLEALNRSLAEATDARIKAESALTAQRSVEQNSPALSALRQQRAQVAADLAQLTAKFENGYPEVQAVRARLASLDRAIADESGRAGSSYAEAFDAARLREGELRSRVDRLKVSLQGEQAASIQYNIFQREVDTNRQLYDSFLQRYKEIDAAGVSSTNVRVVDRALPPVRPSSPNLLLNLLLGLIVGLIFALLLVIAFEQIDQKLKDPNDVTNRLGLPLLGVIPLIDEGRIREDMDDPKSDLAEAVLSFQTNLSFLTDHGIPRSILFTSTRPNEGKSSSTIALARSLARTGKRVLLIDADMRNSSVHKMIGVTNQRGLSNFLAGDEYNENLLTDTGVNNLKLLSAGPTPPNAGELLLSPRLAMLVDRTSQDFDVTIIDAPPVLGLADAPLVAQVAEGVIYTIEVDGVRSREIQQSMERIRTARANIFGALVTKFDVKAHGYEYGYGYGYGYGRDRTRVANTLAK